MAQFTFKNGKIMLTADASKEAIEFSGKRKTQGEKAAAEQPAQTASKTLSVGNGSGQKRD